MYLMRRQNMPDLGDAAGRAELDRIIRQCNPGLIIFDSLSTLVRSGVENEAESWAPIQDWLMALRWSGRSVLLVHHEGRSGKPRGTSKREDVLDTMIGLRAATDDALTAGDESAFDLSFTKYRDFSNAEAAPRRLHLHIAGGRLTWQCARLLDAHDVAVRDMLAAGIRQQDIAGELNLSKGRISQIVRHIRETDATRH
jgi:putative DNA primase/helicase